MAPNSFLNLLICNHEHGTSEPLGGFTIDELLQELEKLRSMGEDRILRLLLERASILSEEDAKVVARQIINEVEIQIDNTGNGQITIGSSRNEKRYTFFFEESHVAALNKITQPCSLNVSISSSKNTLPRTINIKSPNYPMITAPLGIITLGGYLKRTFRDQVSIEYLDMQIERFSALPKLIKCFAPDIIGLSVKAGGVEAMREILNEITALDLHPRPLVVMGNAVPTYASDYILREFPSVLCVIGRGEPAVKALVTRAAFDKKGRHFFQVPNSSFVLGSTIYHIEGVPFDLSDLGTADWEALFDRYPVAKYQEVWVEASRGCPQKKGGVGCSFCAIMPNNDSQDWVARPGKGIFEEIEVISRLGVSHIRFADEEFMAGQTIDALTLATEMEKLKNELRRKGICMPTFDFAIRVDDVYKRGLKEQREHIDLGDGTLLNNNDVRRLALATFKRAGLIQVYLGLESGSFKQLKRMYKAASPEDNRKAIEVLSEMGIQVAGGWIMIDPLMEGREDLTENIAFLEQSRLIPERLSDSFVTNPINRMRILEGSPLVGILRKHGLLGARKPSLVEYDFRYKDSRIAEIDRVLQIWESEFSPFVYAMKSKVAVAALERNYDGRLDYLATYYFSLKKLDFEFFKEVVNSVFSSAPSCLTDVISKFKLRREHIISALLKDLAGYEIDDSFGTIEAGLRRSVSSTMSIIDDPAKV